ncbi:MAG: SRPBCC family protein [Actinobacteria bacterium]|nr:SRPBCC family protein [Actinomycetota bacterium]
MRLEDQFKVPASPEKTWDLLQDVPEIVPCMPGAELAEVVGENEWKAVVGVKVGPIALRFLADVERREVDEEKKSVVLAADAEEERGRGNAEATIESYLAPTDDGTEVTIITELTLQGAVAQYGRGVVADISAQITREFANNLARKLEEPEPQAGASGTAAGRGGGPQAAAPTRSGPAQKPIGGLRLALKAMWYGIVRRVKSLFSRT